MESAGENYNLLEENTSILLNDEFTDKLGNPKIEVKRKLADVHA